MNILLRTAVMFIAGTACILTARAEEAKEDGNAGLGHSYARASCSGCHGVEQTATTSPNIKATPFVKIAKHPKLTLAEIDGWLVSSHQNMPTVKVPAERRADLIAYIKSLALKP